MPIDKFYKLNKNLQKTLILISVIIKGLHGQIIYDPSLLIASATPFFVQVNFEFQIEHWIVESAMKL